MLLFMDGFDHYGNNQDPVTFGKWVEGNLTNRTDTIVRTGTGSVNQYYMMSGGTSTSGMISKKLPASGGFVVGMAARWSVTPSSTLYPFLRIREGAVTHIEIGMIAPGLLVVSNGSGTVLATAATPFSVNSWWYIEFKGIIHDTTGSFEVRVDGVSIPSLTMTNVDTRNGGTTGQWDRIALGPIVGSWYTHYDDLYVCDMSGALRNDFLGAIRIETLMPQAGNGSNVGLTPSTGTDHGALVDELPPNTTDWNSSATVDAKDTYNLPPMVGTGEVLAVQTNLLANKSDVGLRQVCVVARTGGVDYDGPNITVSTSFLYTSDIRVVHPVTGESWTPADINALEIGMKVTV